MGLNNSSYKFFQEMLTGYQYGYDGMIEHGARCLMELNPENPFPENSQERELFYSIFLHYTRWKRGSVDAKINLRKLLSDAKELCEMVKENPYVFSEEEELEEQKQAEEQEKQKEAPVEPVETVKLETNEYVFGVIPEEAPNGVVVEEEQKEEPKEEKRNWLKFLFPWRKEENSDDSSRSN